MKKIFTLIFVFFFFTGIANADSMQYLNIDFWNKFDDDILTQHLMDVYQNNNDLKAAVLKVSEANRVVKMSFANELPHVGFQGYVGQIFHSSDEIFGTGIRIPDYTEAHFLFPITMNYEIDIWGQNRLRTKSKQKQFEMIQQDEKAAYIYVSSAFAANYYNLIRLDKLIEYQNQLISIQNKVINSYKTKYEFGTATLSDIEQAQKNLTFLQEDLKKLNEKQDMYKNQLSVLLSDRSFNEITRTEFNNINTHFQIPNNIKFETLENRPDRVKSQLDLEKIGIDIKVAKKDLLPKFIITGDIGFNFYNISSPHNFLANIGVVPSWDLFAGGKKLQMVKFQKDKYDVAIESYEKTVLTSMQESNDALYSLKTADNIKNITNKRLDVDKREMKHTLIRQEAGVVCDLHVLLQEQKVIASQIQTVNAQINEIIAAINLYQALGGVDFMNIENI